jgi:ketosteroid isomerase-like protein
MVSTEDLARRFFSLVESRDQRGLAELLHPDVDFVPLTVSDAYRGRTDVIDRFYGTVFSWTVYEASASRFVPMSEDTVHAEGRLRWMSNGDLRDVNASWTLQFVGGRLVKLAAGAAVPA